MAFNVLGLVFSSIAWIGCLFLVILFLSLPGHAFEAVLAMLWFAASSVTIASFAQEIYEVRKLQQEEIEEERIREEKRRLRKAEIEENRRREEEQRIKEAETAQKERELYDLRQTNTMKGENAVQFLFYGNGRLRCPLCGETFHRTRHNTDRAMCPNCWVRGTIKEEKEPT